MRGLAHVVVFTTALLSIASAAAPAGAVTWHNSGDTAFTATGGATTYSVTGTSISCAGSQTTGTWAAGSLVGATWTAATITTTYPTCTASFFTFPTECTRTFTATSHAGGVTSGTLDTTCRVSSFGTKLCHIEGTTTGTYVNPTSPSTFGQLTLPTSATLRITGFSPNNCPFGNNDVFAMGEQTLTLTAATGGPSPHLGPIITRTA